MLVLLYFHSPDPYIFHCGINQSTVYK